MLHGSDLKIPLPLCRPNGSANAPSVSECCNLRRWSATVLRTHASVSPSGWSRRAGVFPLGNCEACNLTPHVLATCVTRERPLVTLSAPLPLYPPAAYERLVDILEFLMTPMMMLWSNPEASAMTLTPLCASLSIYIKFCFPTHSPLATSADTRPGARNPATTHVRE